MSGGNDEYVMGNMVDSSGKFYPRSAGTFSPAEKYYDKYSYGTTNNNDATARKRGKLGDATKEVFNTGRYNWNSDIGNVVYSTDSWFVRGGTFNSTDEAGVFYSNHNAGVAASYDSARVTISTP